jgi:rhamnogalacturonyl hydrolase YesR
VAAWPARAQAEISRKTGGAWEGAKYAGGSFRNVRVLEPPPQYTDHSLFIRYEGPGWESDRIGYRFYLDWRNGFDIFGKRTRALVLQDVGLDGYDSYHEPADWGMDILKVASSVGIGGYGAWRDNRVERVSEVERRRAEVTANGPLYAEHRIHYAGWKVGAKRHDLTARLGIHAGSHLTHVELEVDPVTRLATGIVRLPEGERIDGPANVPEKDYTWTATWGPQSIVGDHLGMAVFHRPRDLVMTGTDEHNHAVVLRPRNGRVGYAFGAVWEQEPGSAWDRDSFGRFLEETALLLNRPALVVVENRRDRIHKGGELTAQSALAWTTRLADDILAARGDTLAYGNFDPESGAPARWRYTTALLCRAFEQLGEATGKRRYHDFNERVIGSFTRADGAVETYRVDEYNIDHLAGGRQLLGLYRRTGDERYRKAADLLWSQLATHPRTAEGGFWHKQVYPWQMWLDGLYMGAPFYAEYARTFNHPEAFADIARQFVLINRLARHPQTGWLHHAYDEKRAQPWADPETGLSSEVWGRAVGWFAMALVDVLELLPAGSPEAGALLEILGQVADQVTALQDPGSGLWYQVMDKGGRTGNYLESSASSMFVYALAKAVNRGWLPGEFAAPARRGFEGLLRHAVHLDADGRASLGYICEVAGLSDGRDGSYRYYMSEPIVSHDAKGTGPFLLAGLEVHRLLFQDNNANPSTLN